MILKRLEVGSFAANCYIIGDEISKKGMIIDPGDEADFILRRVKSAGLTVKTIVLTHAHIDHIAALSEVKEATKAEVAIHEKEAPRLNSPAAVLMRLPKPAPKPDRLLKEGDIIKCGGLSFKVIHTPGHTPGGICLLGDGIVFTGDTLFRFGVGRADFPGSSYEDEMTSIKTKLMTLPENTGAYPGHGPETTIGEEKRANPFLREWESR